MVTTDIDSKLLISGFLKESTSDPVINIEKTKPKPSRRAVFDPMRQHLIPSVNALSEIKEVLYPSIIRMQHSGTLQDIVSKVKQGKEASVFTATTGTGSGDIVAAKGYDRGHAKLADTKQYSKSLAIGEQKASNYIRNEYYVLSLLKENGLNVPRAYATDGKMIMMELLGEPDRPAPLLQSANLSYHGSCRRILDQLVDHIEGMLSLDIVHGDLSPFNILLNGNEPYLIDFPQAVDITLDTWGYSHLLRDVNNVLSSFRRYGLEYDADELALSLWNKYGFYEPYPDLNPEMHMVADKTWNPGGD